MHYLYDGSFDGLMTAVFHCYNDVNAVILPPSEKDGPSLFPRKTCVTDGRKADRVTTGLLRLGKELPETLYAALLSEAPEIENAILETIRLGFRTRRDPVRHMQADCVNRVAKSCARSKREAHQFTGLVRLTLVGEDIFVSDIAPDCNILPLIAPHFNDRFRDQRVIIRDLRRLTAVVSDPRGWYLAELPEDTVPLRTGGGFEDMWTRYFRAMAIPSRVNRKLQQRFVPLKYRKYMVEFEQNGK